MQGADHVQEALADSGCLTGRGEKNCEKGQLLYVIRTEESACKAVIIHSK